MNELRNEERPLIVVGVRVVACHPAEALVEVSEGAELLVVGNRGHGGFADALLGSVSTYCVHHAHCPVTVIRPARHGYSQTRIATLDRRAGDGLRDLGSTRRAP
jgi:hypothetical protein